jgi:hypothetical protein
VSILLKINNKMTIQLSYQELQNLKGYKHHADKTTLELFYTNKVLPPVEKLFPTRWGANAITIIG